MNESLWVLLVTAYMTAFVMGILLCRDSLTDMWGKRSEREDEVRYLKEEIHRLRSIVDERDAQTKKYGEECFIVDAAGNRKPGYPWV